MSLRVKLAAQSGTLRFVSRVCASLLLGLVAAGCGARETSLGAVTSPADAGVFVRAPAVAPLSVDRCRVRVGPQLPGECFGGSGPPPKQCVLAVRPDGGVSIVASVPTSGTRSIRRVHGLEAGRVVLEVADVNQQGPATLGSTGVDGGPVDVHLTAPASSTFELVTVRPGGLDAIACEAGGRCALFDVSFGTAAVDVLEQVPAPGVESPIVRSKAGSRSWAAAAGAVVVRGGAASLVTARAPGPFAFDDDDSLFVTEGPSLVRVPMTGPAVTLSATLDEPRGVFLVGGYALVVEARAVRAFPKQGGAPLVLYQLEPSDLGPLTAPRLVEGRLVFDQVCQALTPTNLVSGNVELDFTRGRSRWLNDEPSFPFVRGARPDAPGFKDVFVSPEVIVGLLE